MGVALMLRVYPKLTARILARKDGPDGAADAIAGPVLIALASLIFCLFLSLPLGSTDASSGRLGGILYSFAL